MFHALNKFTKLKNTGVCIRRLYVVREESGGVKLKKFVKFPRDKNEKINLEEMRAKICQLHNIKPGVEESQFESFEPRKLDDNDHEVESIENSPFILEDDHEEKYYSSDVENRKFIDSLKKKSSRVRNFKFTNFGSVRRDDDEDRVITDDLNSQFRHIVKENNQRHEKDNNILSKHNMNEANVHHVSNTDQLKEQADDFNTAVNAFDEEYFNLSTLNEKTGKIHLEDKSKVLFNKEESKKGKV